MRSTMPEDWKGILCSIQKAIRRARLKRIKIGVKYSAIMKMAVCLAGKCNTERQGRIVEGMIYIRNGGDLKMAYEILMEMQALQPLPGREEAAQGHIRELKKDIRDYFRQLEKDNERRIICDNGINGYIELVRLPESLYIKDSAESYFEEKEVLQCPDLPGGCTGHPFTRWYRIICRQGRMWAYHKAAYDV